MSTDIFLLLPEGSKWTIVRLGDTMDVRRIDIGPESDTFLLKQTLTAMGYANHESCLALPSGLVHASVINTTDLPRKGRSKAMTYRLEEQIPLEAEAITTAFLPSVGGRCMGTAIDTARVQAILDAMLLLDVNVTSICPLALLALWQCLSHLAHYQRRLVPDYIVLYREECVDIFYLQEGVPLQWFTVGSASSSVERCITTHLLNASLVDRRCDILLSSPRDNEELNAALADDANVHCLDDTIDADQVSLAVAALPSLHKKTPAGWINLRHQALKVKNPWARFTSLNKSLARASATLLVLMCVTFIWKGIRYKHLEDQLSSQILTQYTSVFPNTAVPANIGSRLRSESRRLAAISGSIENVPHQHNATQTLRQILASLPAQTRIRFFAIQLGPRELFLEGEARNHTDAQVVVNALKKGNLAADAPRTEHNRSGGVSFMITANHSDSRQRGD